MANPTAKQRHDSLKAEYDYRLANGGFGSRHEYDWYRDTMRDLWRQHVGYQADPVGAWHGRGSN